MIALYGPPTITEDFYEQIPTKNLQALVIHSTILKLKQFPSCQLISFRNCQLQSGQFVINHFNDNGAARRDALRR